MSRVVYLPTLCGEGNPFWVRSFVYINEPVAGSKGAPPEDPFFRVLLFAQLAPPPERNPGSATGQSMPHTIYSELSRITYLN